MCLNTECIVRVRMSGRDLSGILGIHWNYSDSTSQFPLARYESNPPARDEIMQMQDGAAARETYKTGARCYVALLFAGCW